MGTLTGDVVVGSQVSLEATTLEGRELKTGLLTIKELPKTTERDLFDSDLETLDASEEIGEAPDNSDSNAPLAADPLLDVEEEDQPAPPRILPLRVAGSQMFSPRISLQSQPLELQMNWEDVNGLADAGGHRIRVEPLEDQKPVAYIQDLSLIHI